MDSTIIVLIDIIVLSTTVVVQPSVLSIRNHIVIVVFIVMETMVVYLTILSMLNAIHHRYWHFPKDYDSTTIAQRRATMIILNHIRILRIHIVQITHSHCIRYYFPYRTNCDP